MYQRKFLLQIYHAYVTSVIKYGLLNYGSTRKTHLENIYKAQRRIIRAFFSQKTTKFLVRNFNEVHHF